MTNNDYHITVLLEEAVEGLDIKPDGVYVDATFGGGGHSRLIYSKLSDKGSLIAFDQDKDAFVNAIDADNFILIHSNFIYIRNFLDFLGIDKVDGVVADLGVSTHHLDMPERGFSYRFDAPLDMRMNTRQNFTAADLLNTYDKNKLTEVFRQYGELRNARQIATAIVGIREEKPFKTTFDLVEAVERFFPNKIRNKSLSKVFQAIRIEVNKEIDVLKSFLLSLDDIVRPGGRVAIISFHSLEDRLVKNYFKTGDFTGNPPRDIYGNFYKPFKQINKKVIVPSEQEIASNPRARSAKLRIAEKL